VFTLVYAEKSAGSCIFATKLLIFVALLLIFVVLVDTVITRSSLESF